MSIGILDNPTIERKSRRKLTVWFPVTNVFIGVRGGQFVGVRESMLIVALNALRT